MQRKVYIEHVWIFDNFDLGRWTRHFSRPPSRPTEARTHFPPTKKLVICFSTHQKTNTLLFYKGNIAQSTAEARRGPQFKPSKVQWRLAASHMYATGARVYSTLRIYSSCTIMMFTQRLLGEHVTALTNARKSEPVSLFRQNEQHLRCPSQRDYWWKRMSRSVFFSQYSQETPERGPWTDLRTEMSYRTLWDGSFYPKKAYVSTLGWLSWFCASRASHI